MPFIDFWRELEGTYPKLSSLLAQIYVNRAWQDIRDAGPWSFLQGFGILTVPAIITTGAVTVTNGSTSIVANTTAATALNAVVSSNPPLASTTLGVGRQIRIGSGPVANILTWTMNSPSAGLGTMTVDLAWQQASASAQPYTVYRSYYATPSADFLRYTSINNPQQGYAISGQRLAGTQEWLNAIDPQRGSTGDPYNVVGYLTNATGHPVHEFWPGPQNAYGLFALFQKRGDALTAANDLPAVFPSGLLMERAHYYACDWAGKNVGQYRELRGVAWEASKAMHLRKYSEDLAKARRNDKEIFVSGIVSKGANWGFPWDGNWLQSHAPWGSACC
jgi:hypothetical protein